MDFPHNNDIIYIIYYNNNISLVIPSKIHTSIFRKYHFKNNYNISGT